MPETLGQRVRSRRAQFGWTQKQLAERIGVKQPTINDLESDRIKQPGFILKLAEVLNEDPYWLLYGDAENAPRIIRVPILTHEEVADFHHPIDLTNKGVREMVPVAYHHGDLLAVRVDNTSINKIAKPGAIAVIDTSPGAAALEAGKLYLFKVGTRATLKLYEDAPEPTLSPISTDKDWQPISIINGPPDVIGRVVYIMTKPQIS